ncbi:hypothetical protein HHK36_021753 [Tetracentron sinense]|uniref:Xaa-Pro dipeptidase n=1 Tax=Tetracentron sinense TaxID=13715 RepID=A0A834YQB9_TETSI|nr:hypothetical protein HHK36_021753 [Tetracentron sinense]
MAKPREAISSASSHPPEIPMELHAINREKLIQSIRKHLTSSHRPLQGFVFLQGGEEQTRYCTDHAELFRQESYFAYLFGVREPGFYGAIDIATGKSILFAPRLPAEYAVWLGEIKPLSNFKERYMVSMVYHTEEIVGVLHDHYGGLGKPLLFLLHGLNTDSNKFSKPAEIEEMEKFETDLSTLHPLLVECRIFKSDLELALIQYANDISSEAHIETLKDGDMALLDMGAEYHFYGSDITCSFPVNGKFTSDQCLIYNAVLEAHNAVISTMKPGVSWVDMHNNVDDMMAERLGAVFMPHGLGHFLGIDTHDPGGYAKGMERPKEPGLRALRTIRELQEGMVITVEPGCYFIDALLVPAMKSSTTSKFFNHEEIGRYESFGGVRIESDVHVTSNGSENLTKCPRETWEIEAVMAGAPWPLDKSFVHTE